MKALAGFGLIGGLLLLTVLVVSSGIGGIWNSASVVGVGGFAAVCLFHLAITGPLGLAWWLLVRGRRDASWAVVAWGRLIRDSASEALPLSQIGGYLLGARAAALAGLSGTIAAASTVVDITVELFGQLAYTLLGLVLLDRLRPDNTLAGPVLLGVVVMTVLAALFVALQARSAGFLERASLRLARQFLGRAVGEGGGVQAAILAIYRRRAALPAALATHLSCWMLSGLETWLTLRLMGVPIGLPAALAIDSLLYGMRSVAFMVPNALGVQEGALLLLGGLFGVSADQALALSLIKRARDLVIGVPALLVWLGLEGRRVWHVGVAPNRVRGGQAS